MNFLSGIHVLPPRLHNKTYRVKLHIRLHNKTYRAKLYIPYADKIYKVLLYISDCGQENDWSGGHLCTTYFTYI